MEVKILDGKERKSEETALHRIANAVDNESHTHKFLLHRVAHGKEHPDNR